MKRFVAQVEFLVGALLLLAIVVLVFMASVMRHFGYPLIWSIDLAKLLFIWLCFVGATRAMRVKSHIGLDLVVRMIGHKYRLWLETAQAILFIAFMSVLAWEGYLLAEQNKERIFGDSGISYAFVTMAVPIGCVFLSLAIIANAVDAWRDAANEKKLIFTRHSSELTPEAELPPAQEL